MKHLYKEYLLENWCISTCALNNKGSYLFMGSATLAQKDGSTFHQDILAPPEVEFPPPTTDPCI